MDILNPELRATLGRVAEFYDRKKVGDAGALGFRRSTDLTKLLGCLEPMLEAGIIVPRQTRFLDLGCADGRVNVLLSYLVRSSIGIELDEWTLDEYASLRKELERSLRRADLPRPPQNVFLLQGDSTADELHSRIKRKTGIAFDRFDIFYTYLVMHAEFAELLARRAKKGAIFMVYGLDRVLPRYPGFQLLEHLSPMEGGLTLYSKV
jgi:SAM-dependent methyltransferase